MLSDNDNQVALRFGIVFAMDPDAISVYGEFEIDLAHYNGSDSWELPVPATYVVDRTGTVTYAFIDPNYRVRVVATDVLAAVLALASQK